ncbi:MAG: site-specific integrase [Sandaracinaceae bacterium]|nr:site-specific integrase [Sandaracinaceae bacterium]
MCTAPGVAGGHRDEGDSLPRREADRQGKFLVRFKAINPKTGRPEDFKRRVDAATAAEAARLREKLREEEEAAVGPLVKRERLADVAESWMRTKTPALKKSTRRTYADVLDLHVLPMLGDYYLDAVRAEDVVRWRDEQATTFIGDPKDGRLPSPTTINTRLRVVKQFFADVTHERGLPNPAARISSLRVPRRRQPKGLTAEELHKVLTAMRTASPRWYPITLTLALTGARWGEVAALRWDHIDEKRKVIIIEQAHVRGHVDETKTGIVREVPLADELSEVLKEHRRQLVKDQNPGLAAGWVFPGRSGTLMQPASLRKPLAAACTAAEVRVISPHGLRYTFNHLARQVAAGEVVRAMTGHVTEEMTRHYDWVEDHEKRGAHAQLVRLTLGAGGTSGGTSPDRNKTAG